MPVIAYFFIVALLRAVKKIVKNKPYKVELFWSGSLFALIVWTISMLAFMATQY
ncbi:hypothetical protein ACK8P5_08985 [Paenibacillus sp. EC2-1]|uniref:hypothetical protein n=1 Tax=Paenibacillus sp. EC2-1 TaxID=3388665 RepID=UPI003BEEE0EC